MQDYLGRGVPEPPQERETTLLVHWCQLQWASWTRVRSAWGGSLTPLAVHAISSPDPHTDMPFLLYSLQSLSPPEKSLLDHLATWFHQVRHQENA